MFTDTPKASFVIQYFGNFETLKQIIARLKGYGDPIEIIVHNDSVSEMEEIMALLDSKNDHMVMSNDIHEIRAYNHCVSMCSSNYVIILQDDDLPSNDREWLNDIIRVFEFDEKIGLIGMRAGSRQRWFDAGVITVPEKDVIRLGRSAKTERWDHLLPDQKYVKIPDVDHVALFDYVCQVILAPVALRKDIFLQSGKFPLWVADVGDVAPGLEIALCYRIWECNYRVAFLWSESNLSYREREGNSMSEITPEKLDFKNDTVKRVMSLLWDQYNDKIGDIEERITSLNEKFATFSPSPDLVPIKGNGQADTDGWVKTRASYKVSGKSKYNELQLTIEFPGWGGAEQHRISVHQNKDQVKDCKVSPGYYRLIVPVSDSEESKIHVNCSPQFKLPDGRKRSFRVAERKTVESTKNSKVSITRLEQP